MKLTPSTSGTFAIAPTPFFDDGRIDAASIDRMTDFYLETGCTGITVLGIMGEAPKLEPQEALDVACADDQAGRLALRSSSAFRRRASRPCARSRAASWRRARPG